VLSYTIKDYNNKIWITKNLPLPVKAEIFNVDGILKYKYDLISTNIKIN
jgi:hypothetical protein